MRVLVFLLTLLFIVSCGRDQSDSPNLVQTNPSAQPTPAASDVWKRVEEMYPINKLLEGQGSSGVIVVNREISGCPSESENCLAADFQIFREKNPKKYRAGDYIYEVIAVRFSDKSNLTEVVRDCLNKQADEIARLDEIAPELRTVYKVLSLDSISVYQRPYRVLSRRPLAGVLRNARITALATWRAKGQKLYGKNVILISSELVINQDEVQKCSIIKGEKIYQELLLSRSFAIGESELF